jgi:uncharacterized membrane protein
MIQKIREATSLLIENLALFSSIVLTVWLPGSIVLVYLRLFVFPEMTGGDELRILAQESRVSSAIELIFGPLYVGAILYAASQFKQGLRATYGESMAHSARRSFKLLMTRIGTGLIVLAGLIALIIPGVFLALRFALIDPIVVLEGVEGANARSLSTKLTKGKRWNIFGTMLLTFVGVFTVAFLVSAVLYLPLLLAGQPENFVIAVIGECITNILLVIPVIILFLFYWDAKSQRAVLQLEDKG